MLATAAARPAASMAPFGSSASIAVDTAAVPRQGTHFAPSCEEEDSSAAVGARGRREIVGARHRAKRNSGVGQARNELHMNMKNLAPFRLWYVEMAAGAGREPVRRRVKREKTCEREADAPFPPVATAEFFVVADPAGRKCY